MARARRYAADKTWEHTVSRLLSFGCSCCCCLRPEEAVAEAVGSGPAAPSGAAVCTSTSMVSPGPASKSGGSGCRRAVKVRVLLPPLLLLPPCVCSMELLLLLLLACGSAAEALGVRRRGCSRALLLLRPEAEGCPREEGLPMLLALPAPATRCPAPTPDSMRLGGKLNSAASSSHSSSRRRLPCRQDEGGRSKAKQG